jgi:uncharacterized membrane protein YbaN (DUF454 family)
MLWFVGGALSLLAGLVGILIPVLPTVPFVLLAAFCFSRGSERCERWIVEHRYFGPMVVNWRQHRAVPLRAKQAAALTMTASSVLAWFVMPGHVGWIPAVCCAAVGFWLWRLPTAAPRSALAVLPPQGSSLNSGNS